MHAIRPLATCGVALLAASSVALAPTAPASPPVMRTAHSAVELAAIPSPFELYPQVFVNTLKNAGMLAEMYFADPFPITRAILANQAAALSDAAAALANGDGGAAFSAVIGAITQPLKIREAALTYLNETFTQPGQELFYPVVAVAPLVNGIVAAGVALKEVIEAVMTFDLIGLVNAIVNIPARIVDGILNGNYFLESSPGLLTPGDPAFTLPGPLAALIDFKQGTADAIPPWSSTEPATSNASPNPEANTLRLTSDQSVTDEEGSSAAIADLLVVNVEVGNSAADDLTAVAAEDDGQTSKKQDVVAKEAATNQLSEDTYEKNQLDQTGDDGETDSRNAMLDNAPVDDQVGPRQSKSGEVNEAESDTSEAES